MKIYGDSDSISVRNKIYIIGGPASREMYEVDFKNNKLIQMESMLTPKYRHALCHAKNCIYSIGGYNDTKSLKDCEKYSIVQNNWRTLPKLRSARRLCAAFTFNDTYLYCLCGHGICGRLNSMEMKNIEYGEWIYVNVLNMLSPRDCIHGIQLNKNEVIVFGGNDISRMDDCYILNMVGAIECRRACDLWIKSAFRHSASPVNDGVYVYGCDVEGSIHIYSMKSKRWTCVY